MGSTTTQASVHDPHMAERAMLRRLFNSAIESVSAARVMPKVLPSPRHGRVALIAVGKAAAAMADVALDRLSAPAAALVVSRYGHMTDKLAARSGVQLVEAGHPYPDAQSIRAAERSLEIAQELEAQDHLLVLLSGGGSALLAAPAHGITLSDKQATTRALLESGATIAEINCVRKHLSRIKGGRLALAAGPASVTTLMISDVPGDDPSFVSSGPTVPDHTTLDMAREILRKYGIAAPTSIIAALDNPANETPPADSLGLAGVETVIIARARDALRAAAKEGKSAGYVVMDLGDQLQAEARHLGASHAALARRMACAQMASLGLQLIAEVHHHVARCSPSFAAARKASRARAMITVSTPARPRLSAGGVSLAGLSSAARIEVGAAMPYLRRISRAMSRVVWSGTVGPEETKEGSSPGTSEMISVVTLAGPAASASLPPLIRERCFLTQLISAIVAPDSRSARVVACLSERVIPCAGAASSAEPPPERSRAGDPVLPAHARFRGRAPPRGCSGRLGRDGRLRRAGHPSARQACPSYGRSG